MHSQTCTVLVAEDDPPSRLLTLEVLKLIRCVVIDVANGRDALRVATSEAVDLVLMDVHMPLMSGIEATRSIRDWEAASNQHPMLIVGLTASAMPYEVKACLEAGMNEVLVKPIEIPELKQLVEEACANAHRHQRRQGASSLQK